MSDTRIVDVTGSGNTPDAIIDELSNLLAQQKLIPFFGAGVSRQHLGFAGSELAQEMAAMLGMPPDTLLSDLADAYIDRHGEQAFADFLQSKLKVSVLDEMKAQLHHLLLSLSANVLYTTNQDNIYELVAEHYGRPCQRIVTIDDLSEAVPGNPLLVKFHGDPDIPSSLVFSTRSYKKRMKAKCHPLDIRLHSDLLGKRLLFVGYSLRDENVSKLLANVKRAFAGNMPPSYLVAFEYTPSMEALTKDYGVRIIDPRKLFPELSEPGVAFERTLSAICDRTIKFQAERGLTGLFNDGPINPRILMEYQLSGLEKTIEAEPFDTALRAFRGLIDQTRIPPPLLERVSHTFQSLAEKVDPTSDRQMKDLHAALFNYRVPQYIALHAVACFMRACNRRPASKGFDEFGYIACPALSDGTLPAAAALAVAMLRSAGETISDGFRSLASSWFEGYQDLPPEIQESVKVMIMEAWPGDRVSSSPLNRPRSPFRAKGFHSILNELLTKLPKKFDSSNE